MVDVFRQNFIDSQRNKDPFQRAAEAANRNTQKIQAVVMPETVDFSHTTHDQAVLGGKTYGDYAQDTAVSVGKSIVGVPQAIVGAADLVDYGVSSALKGYQEIGAALGLNDRPDYEVQTGRIGNWLENNSPIQLKETQGILDSWKSEEAQRQMREFQAIDGLSTDKTAGQNWDAFKDIVDYAAANPSLAVGATIESLPQMGLGVVAGGAASKGLTALSGQGVAANALRSGVGEGLVMAGAAQEGIRQQTEDGLTTPDQSNLAAGVGLFGGLVGTLGARAANRLGLEDIESSLAARALSDAAQDVSRATNIPKYAGSIVQNSAEEFIQTVPESVAQNIALDRPLLEGVGQDAVLGTMAGGITSAAMSAPSMMGDTVGAASDAVGKVKDKVKGVKEKVTQASYEEMSDINNAKYNPAQAFQTIVPDLDSEDEAVRTQANERITQLESDLNTLVGEAKQQLVDMIIAVDEAKQNPNLTPEQSAMLDESLKEAQDVYHSRNQKFLDLQQAKADLENHSKVTQGDVVTQDQVKANVAVLTDTTTEVTPELEQQRANAVSHVTKHFSSYSPEDLNTLADSSNVFTEDQKGALRKLAEVKVLQNTGKAGRTVNREVFEGFKGNTAESSHRGLNDYHKLVERAVANGDAQLLDSLFEDLDRWAVSHTNKAARLQEALKLVTPSEDNKNPLGRVQVVRTGDRDWKIVTDRDLFVPDKDAKKLGVYSVSRNSNKSGNIDLIQEEANVIAATNSALISYAEQFGNTPVHVTPTEPEVIENVLTNNTNQNEDGDIQSQAKPLTQETSNESGQAETNTRATNPVRRQSVESKKRENDSNKRDGERTNREDKDSQDARGSNGSNQASSRNIKSITPAPYEGSVSKDKEGKTITWFHGTKDDFTEFDLNHPNRKDHGWLGTGVYLTDSEDVATEYSNRKRGEGNPRVLKLNVDESKLLKLTMEDRNLIAKRDRKFSDAFTAWAKEQGYEGIILEHGNEWGNEIVIFDPKRVRILTDTQDGVTSSKPDPEALVPALRNRTAQQRKEEQRKHFKKRNMLTAHFDQKSEKTNNPLVMVKDFLSSIKNDLGISAFYSGEITPQQENQLAHFTQFADILSKEIQKTFKVKNADYRHLDFVQFLADEQGVLDENTLTGLSVAVYSWVLEKGGKSFNTDDDIRELLHVSEDTIIPTQVADVFRTIGNERSTVAYVLGKRAAKALGLKVRNDSDPNFQSRLEASLGGLILSSLSNAKLLETTEISAQDMAAYAELIGSDSFDITKVSDNTVFPYVRFAQGIYSEEIIELNKGTKGFLTNLFGTQIGLRVPLLEQPTEYVGGSVNKTDSVISTQQIENIVESQKNGFTMRTPVVKLFKNLAQKNRKYLNELLGIHVDEDLLNKHHISKRKSVEAKALNAQRELDNALDFLTYLNEDGNGNYTEFWDSQYISANNRMYYNSNMFNVQTSQIHRAMAGLTAFNTEIDLNKLQDEDGVEMEKFTYFMMGVAEGMEGIAKGILEQIRTTNPTYKYNFGTVDKVAASDFVPELMLYLNQDKVTDAVSSMIKMMNDTATVKDSKNIQAIVDEWGMGVQSLMSLIHLAEMAQAEGGKFTSTVGLGSDGVNNGVAIANLQTGVITPEMRTQTGIILLMTDQAYENMQDVYRDGVTDYYVSFGAEIQKQWEGVKTTLHPNTVKALEVLFVSFNPDNMRKIAKAWSVPFNYSAGFPRLKEILTQTFLDGIYDQMVKIADEAIQAKADGDQTAYQVASQKRDTLEAHLNTLLYRNPIKLPKAEYLKEWDFGQDLNGKMSLTQQKNILGELTKHISFAHGKAAENATKVFAGDYIKVRDVEVAIHRASFILYDYMYNKAVEAKIAEYRKDGLLDDENFEGLSQQEINQIKQQVRKYAPVLNTVLSGQSQNSLEAGITLTDQNRTLVKDQFATESTHNRYGEASNKKTRILKIGMQVRTLKHVGVKGYAAQVQATDAAVSSTTTAKTKAINVHDANIGGVANFKEMALTQNKAFLDSMINHHVQLENAETLLRTLQGVVELGKTLGIPQSEIDELLKSVIQDGEASTDLGLNTALAKFTGADVKEAQEFPLISDPVEFLRVFTGYASTLDNQKLSVLEDTYAIHQYAGEGGAVVITSEQRKKIQQEKLNVANRKSDILADLVDLSMDLKDVANAEKAADKVTTKTGRLDSLQNWLHQRKDAPIAASDLLGLMDKVASAKEKEILKVITPLLGDNLFINYFDDANVPAFVDASDISDLTKVHAWFDAELNTVNIRSVDSKGSKVDTATVVHELIHAALATRIAAVENNSEAYPEATKALEAIEKLRTDLLVEYSAQLKAENKKLRDLGDQATQADWAARNAVKTIVNMLDNADEFIAYGLTDVNLQSILSSKMVEREGRAPSKLKSIFKSFLENVATILGFRSKQINAFSALVHDTAQLMQHLDTVVPKTEVGTLFSKEDFNNPNQHVNNKDTLDVLKEMHSEGLSPEMITHLDHVIDTTIGQLYRRDAEAKQRITEIVETDSHEAAKAGFNMTDKERHVQQTVKDVLSAYLDLQKGSMNVGMIRKLYDQAKAKIKPSDFYSGNWATATEQDKDLAQEKYDYVFKAQGSTDVLVRFMSMALSNNELRNILQQRVENQKIDKSSWFKRISTAFEFAVAWLGDRIARVSKMDSLASRLDKLSNQLVKNDIKARQESLAWYNYTWNLIGKVTTPLNKVLGGTASYVFNRDLFTKSKYKPLRVLAKLSTLSPMNVSEDIPKAVKQVRDAYKPNQRLGEVMEVMSEMSSPSALRKLFDALIRRASNNSQNRQAITDNTKKAILAMFKDGGKHLSKDEHKAITYVLMRSDIQSLLNEYDIDTVMSMLNKDAVMVKEMKELENLILSNPNGSDMISRAKQLAYYMITNKGGEGLVKNAVSIASGIDTHYQTNILSANNLLVKQIDRLVSMYALQEVSPTEKAAFKKLLASEPDAIKGLIQIHHDLDKDSYKDFESNPLSYTKGYMPEIVNPYREVRVAASKQERDVLKKQGWKVLEQLKQDPLDVQGEKFLMIHHDRGYQRIVSGAVDLMDTDRKGTSVVDRSNPAMGKIIKARLKRGEARAKQGHQRYNPEDHVGLIATYDVDGNVLAYRYEMSAFVRDNFLERNNNFADLLGALAGNLHYKPINAAQHSEVVDVLVKDYKENYRKNPKAYVAISPHSTNPKDQELWRMLPHDFKEQIIQAFGKGNPIVINNDILNMVFGFKKYSLSQMFDKSSGELNGLEKILVGYLRTMFGDKAQGTIAMIEHIWQDIVRYAKDTLVIRSIKVLWGNMIANTLLLMASGINPVQIAKDTAFALRNARDYRKNKDELIQLEAKIKLGGNTAQIEERMAVVQQNMASNPLREFIEAGMLSTIVEDVMIQSSDYTYASDLEKSIEAKTAWIPEPVKEAAKFLMVSPSTPLYQMLATTTQLSDFVAKYSIYKKARAEGKNFEDATLEASQTFINYDVPTSRGMQYMNDMGFFMFTKFFLRFQHVLMRHLDKRAASVIGQHMAVEMFTDTPGVLDPMLISRLGNNPFEGGALSIFGAVSENPFAQVVF